jgi:hypothetical protein
MRFNILFATGPQIIQQMMANIKWKGTLQTLTLTTDTHLCTLGEFELTIPASDLSQTHALDRAATWIEICH